MIIVFALIVIWLAFGEALQLTGLAGYDLHGSVPWYGHLVAHIATAILSPAVYLFMLITGKEP